MTAFIPEWGQVGGAELQLRRLFNELGADAVLRKPLDAEPGRPDYFIECGADGWLAVAVCRERYADIESGQLFDTAGRADFLSYLSALDRVSRDLPVLVVMWSCSRQEATILANGVPGRQLTMWSREELFDRGCAGLRSLLCPVSSVSDLKRKFFPEAEITAINVGRRQFHRDNSATLTGFFLDSEQEWASKLDLEIAPEQERHAQDFSVRLLNGVAGSGKTLIALQRAILLARRHPDQRILLLIFNTPVVADLAERMARLGRPLPPNVEMRTFASWATMQWRRLHGAYPTLPQGPGEVLALVRQLRQALPQLERLPDQQLVEELDYLNDALISDEAGYLAADRAGRGFALRERDRELVWALYLEVTERLSRRGMRLWSAIASEICRAGPHGALRTCHHILVDEAQFLAPASLQLVKHALIPTGSLFLCADPRQGFLRSRLSWKSVGLDVAGRTRKLRKSYRTTSTLLQAATCLLAREVDDDPEDFLAPDYSGMAVGTPPVLVEVASPHDAIERLANEIAALAARPDLPLSAILVLYGDRVPKSALYARLCRTIGSQRVWWLNKSENRKLPPGGYGGEHIRLVSLDSATGLEAPFVFLVGVENLLRPPPGGAGPDRTGETMARKMYMAMTRSCHHLTVISSECFGPDLFKDVFDTRP